MTNICDCIRTSVLVCYYCSAIQIARIIGAFAGVAPFIFGILLVYRDRPALYLNDFHVSLLNNTLLNSSSTTNNTTTMVYFDLSILNPNLLYSLYYQDPLNLTFNYFPPSLNKNIDNVTIGRYTIQGFYQGSAGVKKVRDFVVVQDMFSEAKRLKEPAKVALLSVDLDAKVKFNSIEHMKIHLVARGFVEVNCNTGNVVLDKTMIPLDYTFGSDKWNILQWFTCIVLIVIFLFMLLIICNLITCKTSNPRRRRNHPRRSTNPNDPEPLLS